MWEDEEMTWLMRYVSMGIATPDESRRLREAVDRLRRREVEGSIRRHHERTVAARRAGYLDYAHREELRAEHHERMGLSGCDSDPQLHGYRE